MSLINQMLRDLDGRGASAPERGTLPAAARALPAAPRRRPVWPWLAVLALGAAAAGFRAWFAPAPVVAQGAATPIARPAAEVTPAAPTAAGGASAPVGPPPVLPAAAGDPAVPADVQPRLQRPAAAVMTAESEPRLRAARALSAVPAEAGEAVAAAPAVTAAAEPARIDKQPRLPSARERAEALARRAQAAQAAGRAGEARSLYQQALQEDPSLIPARLALAEALHGAQARDEARQVLEAGLALDPEQPQLLMGLARLQAAQGQLAAAADTLARGGARAAASPEYRALRAGIAARQERHQDAVEDYRAALRAAPGQGVWWMGLGLSLEALGRNPEAREALTRARASGALNAELAAFVEQRLHQIP